MGLNLHQHFWDFGEREDRSPSPLFVPSAYRYVNSLNSDLSPTWKALEEGWEFDRAVSVDGQSKNNGKHIAIFAHSVSGEMFGAELSFLDMVKACFECGYRISLFLPNARNYNYIEELKHYSNNIEFLPLQWFFQGKKPVAKMTDYLSSYFVENHVVLVYLNTIMLFEPYLAAKKSAILSVTHIRELPQHDEHLREILKQTSDECLRRLEAVSDFFIANSEYTAKWINSGDNVFVLNNQVTEPNHVVPIDTGSPLKVCMISSNTQKKGIEDFFHIAELCEKSNIEFNLYGPITNDVKAAEKKFICSNVKKLGYVDDCYDAIQKNDIVLSLSWFQESFGRTVAEAMINKRLVICYDWGAVGSVICESSGMLVPFKRADLVADKLVLLSANKKLLKDYVEKAQLRAQRLFSKKAYDSKMKEILEKILSNS